MIAGGKELFKDFKVVKRASRLYSIERLFKKMIMKGHLLGDQKIPSTRELGIIKCEQKYCASCLCGFKSRRTHLCS